MADDEFDRGSAPWLGWPASAIGAGEEATSEAPPQSEVASHLTFKRFESAARRCTTTVKRLTTANTSEVLVMAARKSKRGSPADSSSETEQSSVSLPLPRTDPPEWTKLPVREQLDYQRIELMRIHAILVCLAEVLLYSDDDDGTMHSDCAIVCGRLINEVVADLEWILKRIPGALIGIGVSGRGQR